MSVYQLDNVVLLTGAMAEAPCRAEDQLAEPAQDPVALLEPVGHCLGPILPQSPVLGLEE